jgi:hypothetical protein
VRLDERFWNKVEKHGPIQVGDLGRCWVWTGSRESVDSPHLRNTQAQTELARIDAEIVRTRARLERISDARREGR